MLKGDDNENGFKTNRSNQQKNKLHVQHTFSSNQQKRNLHVAQHTFLSLPCHCFARLQSCFVQLKHQTSQLHIIFKEELSYVLTQYFVSCVHACFSFSLPRQGFERPELLSVFLFATAKVAYRYITAMIFRHIILHFPVHIYDFHPFITSLI